jgi:hypothetical protein
MPEELKMIFSCENFCNLEVPKNSRRSKRPGIIATRVPCGDYEVEVYSCTLDKHDCSLLELYRKLGNHNHRYSVPPGAHGSIWYCTSEPRIPRVRNSGKE